MEQLRTYFIGCIGSAELMLPEAIKEISVTGQKYCKDGYALARRQELEGRGFESQC